jgi:hypothetical protein
MHYFYTDDLKQRVFDYLTEPIEVDDAAVAKKAPVRACGGCLVLYDIVVPCILLLLFQVAVVSFLVVLHGLLVH